MGDMGKLSLDRWGYHTGITSVADKIPTAGENVHDDTNDAAGQVHDAPNVGVAKTGSDGEDVLGYAYSNDMMTLSLSLSASNAGSEESAAVTINAVEGLSVGGAIGTNMNDTAGRLNQEDDLTTMFATYTMGPVSVGYQGYYLNRGSAPTIGDTSPGADYSGDAIGIAFNVNDNVSIGYQKVSETQEANAAGASSVLASDRDIKSLSAAYSSGGMTMSIQQTDTDNYSFATAGNELDTETVQVTLSFAF